MSIVGSCNSCLLEVNSSQKHINCPDCNRLYHQDCWKRNNNKCTEFGCKGSTDIFEPSEIQEEVKIINTPEIKNNFNEIPENNNQTGSMNFRKVNTAKSSQEKIIILLAIIVILLLVLITYMTFFKKAEKVVINNIESSPTQSANVIIEVTPNVVETPVITPSPEVTAEPVIISETPSPEITSTPEPEVSESPVTPEETPSPQESIAPTMDSTKFNMDMTLADYYTVQISSKDTKEKAENLIALIPDSFIKAKSKGKNDKSKYYYVVVSGKFSNLNDASKYREYIIENFSKKDNSPDISDAFVTESARLENLDAINSQVSSVNAVSSPTPISSEKPKTVVTPTTIKTKNEYYTVQVASKENYNEAKELSNKITDSSVMKKYSTAQKKYYYVVIVGKLENKEKAEKYQKYIIENFSNAGSSEDVPKSWVVNSKGLIEVPSP